jgi:hypothetical protein
MSVANLANFLSGLSVRDVRDVLAREIEASWGPVRVIEDPAVLAPAETLTVLRERYESREWTFGMTPSFTCTVTGAGNLSLLVEHGRVTRAEGLNGAAAEILEKPFDLGLIDSLHKNNHLIAGGPAAEEESNGHPPDVPQAR